MSARLVRNIRLVLPLAALLVVACSCQKEPIWQFGGSNPNIIPVVKSVSTKAGLSDVPGKLISERVVSESDGYELIEMVYENNTAPMPSYADTKGTVVTTDNIKTSGFNMLAYAGGEWYDNTIANGNPGAPDNKNSAGLYFKASCLYSSGWGLTKTAGPARTGTSGELYWLNDVPLTFWSYNLKEPTIGTSTNTASFTYTVNSTVTSQEDLVFAYSEENRKFHDSGDDYGKQDASGFSSTSGASGQNVNIWFYHALSAVQFIQDESLTDYRISEIAVQNVYGTTNCDITATDAVPAASSPNISFAHSPSVPTSFTQGYDSGDSSLEVPGSGSFKTGDAKTFFMVPQELPDNASLKVTFTNTSTGKSETTSPVFSLDGDKWLPGKFYVYKIGLGGAVKVDIKEELSTDGNTKNSVKFQNTSDINEYIRAAVVANWYDDSGNIVAAWDKTRDGSFTLGSGWTENGGFYYYGSPVKTDELTNSLFSSSFTKPTDAPIAGAHFEMVILVQAVASDGISSCTSAFE